MDAGSSTYDKLLNQCKSNDVDAKVDALTKLQAEFEKGSVNVPDSDALVAILKGSLRTSNLHLANATLSALPSVFPVLVCHSANPLALPSAPLGASTSTSSVSSQNAIDIPLLRQILSAFLPQGGLIDRLGDKEKTQAKARESLVLLGGFAFRASGPSTLSSKLGKGMEPPIAIFEKALKESGLASKVWKVREQSVLVLVHIRRAHHLFPIRPYLSLLVDCLEDTDPHVRECARTSIVELFSGPSVNDGARADLKKEMTKKGVRKTIVDGVLSKLLGSQPMTPEEDGASTPKEYIPPSLALQGKRPRIASQTSALGMGRTVSQSGSREIPRPVSRAAMVSPPPSTPSAENSEIHPVYIASNRDLESEFSAMAKHFEGKETEHNWAAREQAIQRVRGMVKGDVHLKYQDAFLAAFKEGFIQWSLKTLASLRTTVSANTCLLYSELAVALGLNLDPFCDVLLTNLLKMAAFTKKIAAQQSQASVSSIISHTSAQPRIVVPLLWQTLQEKTVQARTFVVAHIKQFIELHGNKSRASIESSGSLEVLEKSIKKALADPNPAVRETARTLFWIFEDIWPDHAKVILESLDATAKKQLEKACPRSGLQSTTPSTPTAKKSSISAAIAASRAKAKAIATAPPSLRHQATSGSRTAPHVRASSPSVSPMNSTGRPGSPLRTTTSPTPSSIRPRVPSARVPSASLTRSTSNPTVTTTTAHTRTHSGGSEKSDRAASPSLSDQGIRRRLSSPLATLSGFSPTRKVVKPPVLPRGSPRGSPTVKSTPTTTTTHTTSPLRNAPASAPRRSSNEMMFNNEDSLLMAQNVPIPNSDTESEDEGSVNLMSFSAPFEMFPPTKSVQSQDTLFSPISDSKAPDSVSNALSSGSMSDLASQQPIVEDALRARAEQAESAAERLLELVEPDEDVTVQLAILPPVLSNGNGQLTTKSKPKPSPLPTVSTRPPPTTPKANRAALIMKQAALFADSPAHNTRSPSLLDVLQTQQQETGWWLKRKTLLGQRASLTTGSAQSLRDVEEYISALNRDEVDIRGLKRLAVICMDNTVADLSSPPLSPGNGLPSSPTPISANLPAEFETGASIWEKEKLFDGLFSALAAFLKYHKSEEELALGLIILQEMIANQAPHIDGKEGDIFTLILSVRSCNKVTVLEGTNAIRDALCSKLDPVYGLSTMHGSLRVFHTGPLSEGVDSEVKAATYAFGLMALGKFILRLPAEIAEEEIPRLKGTLITALNDKSSLIVRESAAACIIAAQVVLRDETHLFALLDGLADDKKNLLTYLFDKHGARDAGGANTSSMDKLEKEMRRLDTRTSTPLRGSV